MTPPCFLPAVNAIEKALRETEGPVIVTIDGRCASGKTTLAALCAKHFDCNVFHMDDFFLPYEMRTRSRLATPGGNVDHERAKAQIFEPLSRGEPVTFSRFNCSTGTLEPPTTVPAARLAIVEGSYSHHPQLAGYSNLKFFLTCDSGEQLRRLALRCPEKVEDFKTRWIPMEEAYFKG
ncbi:MAG: uridine kinase, partial [Oscillospiraceae bacterium]|nr:uridine kinase [Oscillospiraceae bacterium]